MGLATHMFSHTVQAALLTAAQMPQFGAEDLVLFSSLGVCRILFILLSIVSTLLSFTDVLSLRNASGDNRTIFFA